MRLDPFALSLIAAALLGCSAQGAVSLTGSIGDVSLQVEEQALVTNLSGSFGIYLELGERASEASDVSFSAFSLLRVDTGAPVLAKEHLSVVSAKTLPVRIQPGNNTTLQFQIGDQSAAGGSVTPMELAKDDFAAICSAGSLRIVGTMQDSANGERPSQLSSVPFVPKGCNP
jgi:hypothetical protein